MHQGLMTEITKDLLAFQRTMAGTGRPVIVKVDVHPEAVTNDCFVNVDKKIAECGGVRVHGWRVYQIPLALMEAEFHAVWESPQGFKRDVSDCEGQKEVVFIPEPKRSFKDRRIQNVFYPLSNKKEVTAYIAACRAFRLAQSEALEGVPFGARIQPIDHPVMMAAHEAMLESERALSEMLSGLR